MVPTADVYEGEEQKGHATGQTGPPRDLDSTVSGHVTMGRHLTSWGLPVRIVTSNTYRVFTSLSGLHHDLESRLISMELGGISTLVTEMRKLRLEVDGKHSVTLPTWDESGLGPAYVSLLSLHPTASLPLLAGVPGPSKSWWTQKSRAGAKEGTKLGTMRRPELSPKILGMESEGCGAPESSLGTAPLLPGTSCPGPTACPGTCWAPPRSCPWLQQVPRKQQSVGRG